MQVFKLTMNSEKLKVDKIISMFSNNWFKVSVRPSSNGWTWEIAKLSRERLQSHRALASRASFASLVLSNLPRASITQFLLCVLFKVHVHENFIRDWT